MPLYLVRHGEAYSETVDPDRSLTEAGRATVAGMAQLAAAFKIPVSQICHSGRTGPWHIKWALMPKMV